MSEQSGPITREQVERAIERAQVADLYGVTLGALGLERHMDAPEYVRHAWANREVAGYAPLTAALTRWRDELAAAEEARRAAVGAWAANGGVLHYSPPAEPERPAPRFKVVDLDPALHETALAATRMLHCGKWPLSLPRVGELPGFDAWNTGPLTTPDWIAQLEALLAEPAPPAPEVVDVPQPRIVVKRCDEVEAEWTSADATILIVTHDALDDAIFVPIALLRAMLAAIDAQQGGAS